MGRQDQIAKFFQIIEIGRQGNLDGINGIDGIFLDRINTINKIPKVAGACPSSFLRRSQCFRWSVADFCRSFYVNGPLFAA